MLGKGGIEGGKKEGGREGIVVEEVGKADGEEGEGLEDAVDEGAGSGFLMYRQG